MPVGVVVVEDMPMVLDRAITADGVSLVVGACLATDDSNIVLRVDQRAGVAIVVLLECEVGLSVDRAGSTAT